MESGRGRPHVCDDVLVPVLEQASLRWLKAPDLDPHGDVRNELGELLAVRWETG